MFLSTSALLNFVKTNLAGRHYSQPDPSTPAVLSQSGSDPKLFERVEISSQQDLETSIKRLRVSQDRVCLIVPVHNDYRNVLKGNSLSSQRSTAFMLLITDRDVTSGVGTMAPNTFSPGLLALQDMSVKALTENSVQIIDAGQKFVVAFEPMAGSPMRLEWEEGEKDARKGVVFGREAWIQIFNVPNAGIVWQGVGRH
jgi:hypothetical protein